MMNVWYHDQHVDKCLKILMFSIMYDMLINDEVIEIVYVLI